jgi:hypothetical protein
MDTLDFIKDLQEARMTRNANNQRVLTYTDCCERLYLSMLVLELLYKFKSYRPQAQAYAKKTVSHDSYKHFRMNSTDLYNFIHFVTGDDDALSKLKDPGSALALRKSTTLPTMAVNRYISTVSSGTNRNASQTFIQIESALRITNTDYKAIRRGLFNLSSMQQIDIKKLVTRLLIASRAKLRSSDIISYLESLAADKALEVGGVPDNEPTVSVPDIVPSGRDLQMYRYFVGTQNLQLTKKFLELAKQGKPIPAPMVQAYLPAIKMLDDIVKAGPSFVSSVRNTHNRAKKYLK